MKLEELAQEQPRHRVGNTVTQIISRGHRYIYVSDPVTGTIERRCVAACPGDHSNQNEQSTRQPIHGMGAVRD